MQRFRKLVGVTCGVLMGMSVVAMASPAGASGVSVKVSPSKGLTNNETVKVTGKGFPYSTKGKPNSFFATECTGAVAGKLSLADAPHCDESHVATVKVSKKGSFSFTFSVITGVIGDGMCGTPGHLNCVIGVGDIAGQGSVGNITFK
jgi:hypothetical protein